MTVTSTATATSGVRITHCGDCREAVDEIVIAGVPRTLDLLPGRYFAVFVADADEPAELTLHLAPDPP